MTTSSCFLCCGGGPRDPNGQCQEDKTSVCVCVPVCVCPCVCARVQYMCVGVSLFRGLCKSVLPLGDAYNYFLQTLANADLALRIVIC